MTEFSPQIDRTYRYWRIHLMIAMYIGYAGFYLTRKSFNFAVPEMIADLGIDKSDIGLMATLFYITYGLSKFFSGIGLIMTGITNIFSDCQIQCYFSPHFGLLTHGFKAGAGRRVQNCSPLGIHVTSAGVGGQFGIRHIMWAVH